MKISTGYQRIAVFITINVNCAAIEVFFSYKRNHGNTTHFRYYFRGNLHSLFQVGKNRKLAKFRRAYSAYFTTTKIYLLYLQISAKQRIGLNGIGKDVKTNCKDRFLKSSIADLRRFQSLKASDTGAQFEHLGQPEAFCTVKDCCVNQATEIGVKDTPMPKATSSASGSFVSFSSCGGKNKTVLDFFNISDRRVMTLNFKKGFY